MSGTDNRPEVLVVKNAARAKAGDTVELDLPGHAELRLSLLVWGVPLVGLVLGAMTGTAFHGYVGASEDVGALIGAVLGFGSTFVLLRRVDRRSANDPTLQPHIVRVVPASVRKTTKAAAKNSCGS